MSLPDPVQDLVLSFLDSGSAARWAQACRSSAAFVRQARGAAIRDLCLDAPPSTGMHRCLVAHRRAQYKRVEDVALDRGPWHRVAPAQLEAVCAIGPERVHVVSSDPYELRDHHLELLSGVRFVAVPGSRGITDAGLAHLAGCDAVWIGGCDGIRGRGLPQLVHQGGRLLSIKWIGGWGNRRPFDDEAARWLRRQESEGLVVSQW